MAKPVSAAPRLGIVEPEDAVAAFQRRDLLLPSFRWHDVWQQEHLRGFAVAGVMRHDILQLVHDELGVALQGGGVERDFVRRVRARLIDKGFWGRVDVTHPDSGETRTTRFNDARLRLIFNTNLAVSYAAGKDERFQRTKKYFPFLRYVTRRDEKVRETHRAWDGVTLPIDDPWWELHKPVKAWNCRCTVQQLSERQVERLRKAGKTVTTPPPDEMVQRIDLRSGQAVTLPRGVDPAFAYDMGKRPLRGVVPEPLLADPFDRSTPTLQPALAMPPPRVVSAGMLLPEGVDEQDAVQAFLAQFGAAIGRPARFIDNTGEDLVISDELFKRLDGRWKVKRGRERFVLLLALAIQQPDEIWAAFMQHVAKDRQVLRRRYLARFRIEGDDKPLVAVFEDGADGWLGVTAYQAENEAAEELVIRSARIGTRLFNRQK
jgi:SPP1 gp7 family putative phage head morphogenesis protein